MQCASKIVQLKTLGVIEVYNIKQLIRTSWGSSVTASGGDHPDPSDCPGLSCLLAWGEMGGWSTTPGCIICGIIPKSIHWSFISRCSNCVISPQKSWHTSFAKIWVAHVVSAQGLVIWSHFRHRMWGMFSEIRRQQIKVWREGVLLRTVKSFRLEEMSKTIESNCSPITAKSPLNHIPQSHIHTSF